MVVPIAVVVGVDVVFVILVVVFVIMLGMFVVIVPFAVPFKVAFVVGGAVALVMGEVMFTVVVLHLETNTVWMLSPKCVPETLYTAAGYASVLGIQRHWYLLELAKLLELYRVR